MHQTCHAVYQKSVTTQLPTWLRRRSRAPSAELLDAALILLRLDLDPLHAFLASLYSSSPRGRPPCEPVAVVRALLLFTLLRYESLTVFAQDLRRCPRLALLAGFAAHDTPCVGAFYGFLDRLENGPYQAPCPHRVPPAELRKGRHYRQLAEEKQQKEARRQQLLQQHDSLTHHLKAELTAREAEGRPRDLQQRLEDLLFQVAVIPSAQRGLLGDLQQLVVCGDGAALVTGASPTGHPTCQCRRQGIYKCACARFYQDASADWGFDSYREVYYFGHTFYQHVIPTQGHDLPVHLTLGPASESDFTLSLKSLDRLRKTLREHQLDWQLTTTVYDSGHDSLGIYEYLGQRQICPVIVLNPRSGTPPKPSGTATQLNAQGVPVCPAGLVMRRHSRGDQHRIYYNCPVKRPTHAAGKTVWQAHVAECPHQVLCQPDTKMGPLVYLRADSDPRFYPPMARDSAEFKRLLALRSGCERSNAVKKVTHKLNRRVCRSASLYLIRLYLISICEHAKAWLSEDRKAWGDDWKVLSDLTRLNAGPNPP
jgi:hypothetical protein